MLGLARFGLLAGMGGKAGAAAARRIERLDPRLDELVPPDAALEVIAEGHAWTEGPVWSIADDALLFSDVPRNIVYRWTRREGVREHLRRSGYTGAAPFAGREPGSNGLAFDREGRLVLCQHGDRRVVRREPDGAITVLADRYRGRRLNSPNDLAFRSNGDLYFTDPFYGLPGGLADPEKELDHQGVYRLPVGGALELLVADLEAPNGIAFSPDEKTLYVSSSWPERPLWMAYDALPDGRLGGGRPFADPHGAPADGPGNPDGLAVDRAGNVFATGPGGVHVFAPDGPRLGRIVTGVATGNVAWGEDGGTLFIAASSSVLRLRTRTRGARGVADR